MEATTRQMSFAIDRGKFETARLFENLSMKIEAVENGPIFSLTCGRTGHTATFTSDEICRPQIIRAKLLEVSGHLSPCSGPELTMLVNELLRRDLAKPPAV